MQALWRLHDLVQPRQARAAELLIVGGRVRQLALRLDRVADLPPLPLRLFQVVVRDLAHCIVHTVLPADDLDCARLRAAQLALDVVELGEATLSSEHPIDERLHRRRRAVRATAPNRRRREGVGVQPVNPCWGCWGRHTPQHRLRRTDRYGTRSRQKCRPLHLYL
eukprot:809642-Prymnesium_polylepis.1